MLDKTKSMNVDDLVAIDIHTHAEEPCGTHGDDGYDDFQAAMRASFTIAPGVTSSSGRSVRLARR